MQVYRIIVDILNKIQNFKSCIDYFCLAWNNCSITLKTSLQKLQNRAARVITGDSYDIRSEQVFGKSGWKTLEERREIKFTK